MAPVKAKQFPQFSVKTSSSRLHRVALQLQTYACKPLTVEVWGYPLASCAPLSKWVWTDSAVNCKLPSVFRRIQCVPRKKQCPPLCHFSYTVVTHLPLSPMLRLVRKGAAFGVGACVLTYELCISIEPVLAQRYTAFIFLTLKHFSG